MHSNFADPRLVLSNEAFLSATQLLANQYPLSPCSPACLPVLSTGSHKRSMSTTIGWLVSTEAALFRFEELASSLCRISRGSSYILSHAQCPQRVPSPCHLMKEADTIRRMCFHRPLRLQAGNVHFRHLSITAKPYGTTALLTGACFRSTLWVLSTADHRLAD